MAKQETWKQEPDAHDYPAAGDYLSLLFDPALAAEMSKALQTAPLHTYKAKDLLRASGLPELPSNNVHVAKDLKKVKEGIRLSPVLLVRGSVRDGLPLIIADGYHRICASYSLDEDATIPCRIVDLPG
ncbi:MAG TPA: hypothetical protein VJU79_02330 [Candidatus Dormibacteraeota bacterium]|nr:hypothetical protein [Candidatus Dormibacteraeota bacterium]